MGWQIILVCGVFHLQKELKLLLEELNAELEKQKAASKVIQKKLVNVLVSYKDMICTLN